MKAKHLMEALKFLDPEDDIVFQMESGCCGDVEPMEPKRDEPEVEFRLQEHGDAGYMLIEFKALPGYHSCRQVGATMRTNEAYWKAFGRKPDGKTPLDPD